MTHIKPPLYIKTIKAGTEVDSTANQLLGYELCDMTRTVILEHTDEGILREIMEACNRRYAERLTRRRYISEFRAYLLVPIDPMEKPSSQVVVVNKAGEETVADSPEYKRYIRRFTAWLKETEQVIPEKPIDYPCQVMVRIFSGNTAGKSLPAYIEATLDCLVAGGILKNKGHRVVVSIDGSEIHSDEKNPRSEIFIRERMRKSDKTSN